VSRDIFIMPIFLRRPHALLAVGAVLSSAAGVYPTPPVSSVTQTPIRGVNPPGITPLVPVYSVAVRAGAQVFVSGMTGVKPGTQDIVDGGVEAQTRQALENIGTSLQSAGATLSDVVECTVFLRDMADYAAMNTVYVEFFPTDPPARAAVAVAALPRPAARVEIKCSAVLRRP
jgi:2-iminobutanoate/2-iminopropanoate deaminase